MHTPFDAKLFNLDVATRGGSLVYRELVTLQGGKVPVLPNFRGSFLLMRTPFVTDLPYLMWQHIWGKELVLGVIHAATPMEHSPSFVVFFLFMCTPNITELSNLTR